MRAQENLQFTFIYLRNSHVNDNVIDEHFSGDSLHARGVFHEQHVQIHVDFFKFTLCEWLDDAIDHIRMDSLVLHNAT